MDKPRTLIFDIETSPLEAYTFQLYDVNIALNQIKQDWHLLAWSAKWLGDPESKIMYMDNRNAKNVHNDKALVKALVNLLNQADIVITQNGDNFDLPKVRARAIINGLPPMKPCYSTDILKEGRKVFKFTSHKLAYVNEVLNTKYKKLDHKEYPGFDLWAAVLKGDKRAWKVMEKYTKYDVLSTEESYLKLQAWIKTCNLPIFDEKTVTRCKCGSSKLERRGYAHTERGKFQIFLCKACGKWSRSAINLLSKDKKKSLLREGK